MKEELGDDWLKPELFRIGASSLLVDVERQLYHHVYGRYAATHEFPLSWFPWSTPVAFGSIWFPNAVVCSIISFPVNKSIFLLHHETTVYDICKE